MLNIQYLHLHDTDPEMLIPILNAESLRTHLVDHPDFNLESIQHWINQKQEIDATPGCRVRAVCINKELAGWCGIQPDDDGFELAIVNSKKFWGSGISIFKTLMQWAKDLGHEEVMFHLLETRRTYQRLTKMANKVLKNELMGRTFTTYYLPINPVQTKG